MKAIQEHVSHPGRSLRYLHFETDAFRGERHRHHHVELTWIEAGSGLRFVGDSALPFEAGDLVLLGAQVPHAWLSTRRSRAHHSVATVLQFSPELMAQPALPELQRALPLLARAALGLRITGACHDAVTRVLRGMASGNDFQRLGGLIDVLGLLVQHQKGLMAIASSSMRAALPLPARSEAVAHAATHGDQRRIDHVIDWIHRHLARELRVDDAARMAHVTPAAFSRYFHREVGKTFTHYLNDVRCSQACVRLRQTDKAVAVVAAECGFATLSHFNRQFRLRHGMAPREFRGKA